MGLLNRYLLRLKHPGGADFDDVYENLGQLEQWGNILPVYAPQMFFVVPVAGNVLFALLKLQSFAFFTRYPNTVITVDLFIDCSAAIAGGGRADFYAYIDNVPIDSLNAARMNEAAVRATVSTGYVTTIPRPGRHTLELWGQKSINAGSFDYGGNIRLGVL